MTEKHTNLNREIQGTVVHEESTGGLYKIVTRSALFAIVFALLFAPQIGISNYSLYLLSYWAITTIAVIGLNLIMGFAGKVSLAQASFMGLGAYISTLLIQDTGMNFWLAFVVATILCMLIGILIGFPALRVHGHYLAFVTLGFNELVVLVIRNEDWLTGGPLGILGIQRPSIFGISLFSATNFYYLCIAMLAIVSVIVWYIIRSPWGRAFKAIRDNHYRAESLGLSSVTYTLLAFAIGSGLAGIAGALIAPLIEFIEPNIFSLNRSLVFLLMVMVGGRGSLVGPYIGVFFVILLPEWLRFAEDYYLIIFSIFVMLLIIYFPQGVAGLSPYLEYQLSRKSKKKD